jgi:hypothetical protein
MPVVVELRCWVCYLQIFVLMSVCFCNYINFVVSCEHMEKNLWSCWRLTAAACSEYLVTRMDTFKECFHPWRNFDKCTRHCKYIELYIIYLFIFTANNEFLKMSSTIFSLQELSYLGNGCSEYLLWKCVVNKDKAKKYTWYINLLAPTFGM